MTGRRLALAFVAVVAASAASPAVADARARLRAEASRATLLPRHSSGRIVIVVSTDLQKLTVYDDGVAVATSVVSTGVADHPTPHGVFSVIQKQRFHASNIYSAAPMPFMQRITWSGVAMHEGHVTGRPASHGCIRLPAAFAAELFRYTREGARVIVARDNVVPSSWGSLSLFAAADGGHKAVAGTAEGDLSAGRFDGEIEARPAEVAATLPGRPDLAANYPVSLLVSRRTGKLYVRRAFKPLFQVPIAIDDPSRPLGTHLFVAQRGSENAWLAATLDAPLREASLYAEAGTRPRRLRDALPPTPASPSNAFEALARLHLPSGTVGYVASLLTPGASLIVSDDGARGRETWDGTDFIALSE